MSGRRGRGKKPGGGLIRVLIVLAAVAYFWPKGAKGPGQAPPAMPPDHRPAPQRAGLPVWDWPRAAADGSALELDGDLAAKNYYVIFDGSGSMSDSGCSGSETKLAVAKRALRDFANAVPKSAKLGLLVFDGDGTSERVPLGAGNRADFLRAVERVRAQGSTPLAYSIGTGIAKLEDQARRQLGYGEYNLVVVTDGQASAGQDPTETVRAILARAPLTVHTIGFCIGEHHSLNQPGRTIYKAADSPQSLRKGLEEVLAESESFDAADFGKS